MNDNSQGQKCHIFKEAWRTAARIILVAFVKDVPASKELLRGLLILKSEIDKLQNVLPVTLSSSDVLQTVPGVECKRGRHRSDAFELGYPESQTPDGPRSFERVWSIANLDFLL